MRQFIENTNKIKPNKITNESSSKRRYTAFLDWATATDSKQETIKEAKGLFPRCAITIDSDAPYPAVCVTGTIDNLANGLVNYYNNDIDDAAEFFAEDNNISKNEAKKLLLGALKPNKITNESFDDNPGYYFNMLLEENSYDRNEEFIRYFPKVTAKVTKSPFYTKGDWNILGKGNSIYSLNYVAFDKANPSGSRKIRSIEDNDRDFLKKYGYKTRESARNAVNGFEDDFDIDVVKIDLGNL